MVMLTQDALVLSSHQRSEHLPSLSDVLLTMEHILSDQEGPEYIPSLFHKP